ncbi:YjjG family noncanonical pyrimidine nucleotidase [Maribacter sp. HTCC2170]|uniref:YjjG family noncanonical pyrimidine nucleotidase n=1 Tax=Maribacter sp. (strain HTCC2170 / KCCM 42371) TaxID=313603 RepID=UPI00006BD502|nr:YjjG family noncanonical pyrimidine nucleotidase [Maribacter sp. HTCC2170]EAR02137.1 haloacid dehalogenase-like hydrolase [Maribacter sp. HTCC2170]
MYKDKVSDVFFDLDHTLWDFEKNSALTFERILGNHGITIDLSDFLEVYIPINLAFWKLYREEKISKSDLRYQRLKTVFDELKYPVKDATIDQLAIDYIKYLSSYNHLFPNTIEILEYLKPNYKLHIITNGFQEIQEKKMVNAKIRDYFGQIINSEMAGVKKPNPIIFQLALNSANTISENSIMIGDSIEADILGAKAVGMRALHFNAHNDPNHEICHMIHDLSEIKSFL